MTDKFAPRLRHAIKRAAFWCLWPAIAVVAWGELTLSPPQEVSELLGLARLVDRRRAD